MEIRYITENDNLLEISNLYEASWKHTYKGMIPQDYLDSIPKGRWADGINKGGLKSLVFIENGKIIGTASFGQSRWEKYNEYGEIVSIYFLPEYIGKGYGKALLSKCVEELRQLGFDKVLLWVLEDNKQARNFYERNGFICYGEYLNDNIGGKDLREVMYVLSTESCNL